MKKKISSLNTKINVKQILPFQKNETGYYDFSYIPYTWLFSSLLFFFIVSVVAPLFWPQLEKAGSNAAPASLNTYLGIAGILIYILEPFIWHNNVYSSGAEKKLQTNDLIPEQKNLPTLFFDLLFSLLTGLLVILPYSFLLIFKPVLRALILYTSFSFLHIGGSNPGENPLFVIMVLTDILLYYLGMIAPQWKYNPVNILIGLIRFRDSKTARITGSILLLIHTALIYAFLLNVVYYDLDVHPEKISIVSLTGWWLLLTLYTRLSFVTDDFDLYEIIKNMPTRVLLINLLALAISFISFIWPFYFG